MEKGAQWFMEMGRWILIAGRGTFTVYDPELSARLDDDYESNVAWWFVCLMYLEG